ncbi:MAG: toxin C-terminal domain-containing protein [Chloroflexales bacterium]|nr:toxin C-terminal domain-containing protein [Chloroflexales bacterium]
MLPIIPTSVAANRQAWQKHYNAFNPRSAAYDLGYTRRIPPQKAPFNSHGQDVFFNGKNYIPPDIDEHNVTHGWKMFNKKGQRIGTYSTDLQTKIGK